MAQPMLGTLILGCAVRQVNYEGQRDEIVQLNELGLPKPASGR
jgi:hypothetical protein